MVNATRQDWSHYPRNTWKKFTESLHHKVSMNRSVHIFQGSHIPLNKQHFSNFLNLNFWQAETLTTETPRKRADTRRRFKDTYLKTRWRNIDVNALTASTLNEWPQIFDVENSTSLSSESNSSNERTTFVSVTRMWWSEKTLRTTLRETLSTEK